MICNYHNCNVNIFNNFFYKDKFSSSVFSVDMNNFMFTLKCNLYET